MKWTRITLGSFLIAFGASMIVGQTFRFQGYIIGAMAITCGVLAWFEKSSGPEI